MTKEINYKFPALELIKLDLMVHKRIDLICKETGTGSIIIHLNDYSFTEITVSMKEKTNKK